MHEHIPSHFIVKMCVCLFNSTYNNILKFKCLWNTHLNNYRYKIEQ